MSLGFALNNVHDIFVDVTTKRLALFTDSNLTGRNLNTRLKVIRGEYILDNLYGIDFRTLFGNKASLINFEAIVKDIIINTEGVDNITRFRFESEEDNPRKLLLSFAVTTIYGDTLLLEEINIG